jgi:hypothetical protein
MSLVVKHNAVSHRLIDAGAAGQTSLGLERQRQRETAQAGNGEHRAKQHEQLVTHVQAGIET